MIPRRIQLSRAKGWKLPGNTVVVSRPSRWGNPFKVGDVVHRGLPFTGRDEEVRDAKHACQLYEAWLFTIKRSEDLIPELKGKNLACWCRLSQPCHADVLLRLANEVTP